MIYLKKFNENSDELRIKKDDLVNYAKDNGFIPLLNLDQMNKIEITIKGTNGSGKTTLGVMIEELLQKEGFEVSFTNKDEDVESRRAFRDPK